jgi:hypothetical protein
MRTKPLRRWFLVALAALAFAPRHARAQFSFTGFGAGQWGASDATFGVAGYTIENFESTTLTSGLLVGWATPAGNVTPAATVPFTFNPVTQDPNGTAFQNGAWDGSNALVNTRTNQSYVYAAVNNWGDIILNFTTPVTSVGFSLQQNDFDVGIMINGSYAGGLQSLVGIVPNGDRYGYIRIDAAGGSSITSLQLANGRFAFNDGFVIDHLAFSAIPEPAHLPLWLSLIAGAGALASHRRRQRR